VGGRGIRSLFTLGAFTPHMCPPCPYGVPDGLDDAIARRSVVGGCLACALSAGRDVLGACVLGMCIIADHLWIRSPDDAKIKEKMLYASSREALRRALVGVAIEIQGTDYSEVAYESGVLSVPFLTETFDSHCLLFQYSIKHPRDFELFLVPCNGYALNLLFYPRHNAAQRFLCS
jgi:hypothetical protein